MLPQTTSRASRQTAAALLMLGGAYVASSVAPVCSAALRRGYHLAWIDPAAIHYFQNSDSVPRNLLYRGGVLAAGSILLLLDAFPERWRRWVAAHDPAELEAGLLAAVAAWSFSLLLAGGFSAPLQGLTFFLGLMLAVQLLARRKARALPELSTGLLTGLSCAAAAAALIFALRQGQHVLICGLLLFFPPIEKSLRLRRGIPRRFTAAFVVSVLFVSFWIAIPPSAYRFPLDISRLPPDLVTFYELHMNEVALDSAMRLGNRFNLSSTPATYGLAAPILMVFLNRAAGFPIDIRTLLKIGFALKYVFVCCSLTALYLYGGRRLLPALLFSLSVLPWNNSANPSLEANHTAVRFIGVPVFFLVLWSARRTPFAFFLAAAAPTLWLCALVNPETAAALFAAALVFAWFRWREDGLAARLRRTAALIASVSPVALFFRSETITLFTAGFGGTDFIASPAPFAVLLTALVVWADVAARPDARSPKNAFRAAAAAFLLIWGAYYVNRPAPANLDLYLYVFAFFAIDLVRAASSGNTSPARKAGTLMLVVAAAPLLTGAMTDACRDLLWELRRPRSIFHAAAPEEVLSGVRVPESFAAQMNAASAVWREHARPGEPCLILTSHPIFLSALTCLPSLPFVDPFEGITVDNRRRGLAAIRSSRANILFIEPDRDLTDGDRRDLYDRLRAELSADFRLRADTPHLEVWERRPPSAADVRK